MRAGERSRGEKRGESGNEGDGELCVVSPSYKYIQVESRSQESWNMTLGSRGNYALIGPKISSRLKIGNLEKCSEGLDEIPVE